MEIAVLVGFCLLLAITVSASCLVYSYYIYSLNRVFSKTRYSILWIIVIGLVIIVTLVAGILFLLDMSLPQHMSYDLADSSLSFTIMSICVVYLILLCIIPSLTNKNKIGYDQILKTDYQPLIDNLLTKIGDVEKLKSYIAKHHKKYYADMFSYYENILKRLKNEKISLVDKMADIVTFNDAFTHKWCGFTNNLQLLLTYQFCNALIKFS